MSVERNLDDFLEFSSLITGFGAYHLRGTGLVELYLTTVTEIVGDATMKALLGAYRNAADEAAGDAALLERSVRRVIMSDPKLGPVTRHLIKLWYVGTWYGLPREWREAYGENEKDRTFVVSAGAYVEGLLWPAIGANPSGAKPLGYGMWATPPRIEE